MVARALWQRIETLHAVTYFAPESIAAAKEAGLRGFWMGYFGFRAAPLGRVEPGAVVAAFANFHPSMVERAIPDAWGFADPGDLVEVRAAAAAAVLRVRVPDIDAVAERVNASLSSVVRAGDPTGRPLFAANGNVRAFDDQVAQLWQYCTTLREHRGDGHVAALVAAGLGGCEPHLLLLADHGTPPEVVLDHRGWSEGDVAAALERLRLRGLVEPGRLELTDDGRSLRRELEGLTDRLAETPIVGALDPGPLDDLLAALTPAARAVVDSGLLPFPNPMGLPSIAEGSAS